MKKSIIFIMMATLSINIANAQKLKPGFDNQEYAELLKIASTFRVLKEDSLSEPTNFNLVYRSPEMGFKNRWALWTNTSGIAVINIRGTVKDTLSELVNTYAAMTAATGKIELEKGNLFTYKLA